MANAYRLLALLGLGLGCAATLPEARQAAKAPARSEGAPPAPSLPAPSEERIADARHLLSRFAFGPSTRDLESAVELGPERWLDLQFDAPRQDPELELSLAPHRVALSPPAALVESWLGEGWLEDVSSLRELNMQVKPHFRDHLAHWVCAELIRHISSKRQIEEVMVDFWTNHFNVHASKGLVKVFAADYVEHAIRPHALARFSELLLATARHPAMLIYLDNVASAAPRPARSKRGKATKARGLNENYARELLELHTLGVDGGYTQEDVVGVARVLSGWTVVRMDKGEFEYVFRQGMHDAGEKVVLGEHFPAGRGEDEGVRLIGLLAKHPATARNVARKLCARFVHDDAPSDCVENAAQSFLASGGDLRAVVRSIALHPSFWHPGARATKLKSPVEFVVSAARALDAKPNGKLDLADALEGLGQPLLEERVPTGYPESARQWSTSGGLLARLNFAIALATNGVVGLRAEPAAIVPKSSDAADLVRQASARLLGGNPSSETERVVMSQLEADMSFEEQRTLVLALLLGSPDFQRQ